MRLVVFICGLVLARDVSGERCQPLYVWSTELETSGIALDLNEKVADQLESAVVQYTSCKVLNRRTYAIHEKHRNNERIIRSINDLDPASVNGLRTIQAKWVVFSRITLDVLGSDSIYTFTSSLEDITTTQIIAKTEKFIELKELLDPISRSQLVASVVSDLFNSGEQSKNVVRSSRKKAMGLQLTASIARSTAERYVQSSNLDIWSDAEKLFQLGNESYDKGQFTIAMKAYSEAQDLYTQAYLVGQSKGARDEAETFAQMANSSFNSMAESCAFDLKLCSQIYLLKSKADSVFALEEYSKAAIMYQLVQQQAFEFQANLWEEENYQFDLVQEMKVELEVKRKQIGTIKMQPPKNFTDVIVGPFLESEESKNNRVLDNNFPRGAVLVKLPWKKKWQILGERTQFKIKEYGLIDVLFKVNLAKTDTADELKVYRIEIQVN